MLLVINGCVVIIRDGHVLNKYLIIAVVVKFITSTVG